MPNQDFSNLRTFVESQVEVMSQTNLKIRENAIRYHAERCNCRAEDKEQCLSKFINKFMRLYGMIMIEQEKV